MNNEQSTLAIYLPREITITENDLRLGQVAIIRGDEPLAAKASGILLGRIPVPGQKIIVERATILSRLACNDIPAQKVTFTGAQATAVTLQQQVIKGERFVELAKSFLKDNRPNSSISQWDVVRMPADLILAGPGKDFKFSPQLIETGQTSQAKVRVTVLADGKELAVREVALRAKSNYRRAVTLTQSAKTAARIGRNESVVIRVEMPGLVVTAMGKTMQDGHTGEHIKVRNLDSQRIILCRVNEDGTVEPIL